MDPRQIKKKEVTFKAGKKPGTFWVISAWALIIFFSISCIAIIANRTPKEKNAQENPQGVKISQDQAELEYWQKQVGQDAGNPVNLSNLAYYYQKLKKYPEAEEYYKQTLKADPKYKFAINNLGLVYIELKKYDKALALWKNALKDDPKNPDYYLGLCELSIEQKDYSEAIGYAEKVIEIDPGNLSSYENLTYIYKIQGNNSKAVETLEKGIEIAKLTGDSVYTAKFNALMQEINPSAVKAINQPEPKIIQIPVKTN